MALPTQDQVMAQLRVRYCGHLVAHCKFARFDHGFGSKARCAGVAGTADCAPCCRS